ncbi:probable cationic amino acid transporter [Cataglyphis hispanica]|uniref:probable cationic amino acid transporter n=1 Tax=Cataglyphis hispanica TaxID=1086592 RepID=UPI00218050AD|nr:probable cationic amino acid transporter [Cataglyphis hispanica]XP_050452779.1 probable cationic amino acid transporter [Cataglyphis hispanica]XP_050452780.1 probable cationic amino acid transporter [Cataglyphis hispanica]XP_050452781.1 probable cationic amino acid transporter [Cataglyphis hispanica]XP_050452782.1 probable cationic amino acid transporter [Cataglyphis hispanica]
MKLDLDREKGLELFGKLIRTKNIESLQGNQPKTGPEPLHPADSKQKLQKCLTTLDLTSLGVGSCVGTGMYLVAGMVARSVAGPGVVISFIIAAIASIFSGACYAEFGVRVPHTTGSAYMYSYVTVGELIAFIIGWNMVLEYLIGTSACACALSACLDALANGAISEAIASSVGTILGRPPDFLAFVITILMMLLMAAGVKKSLVFNNVLNAINLAVWVFVMAAGMFYVDSNNWSEHNGFLPYGWSGVFTGAATCFYAFIGFDIIATTGEEATNPKKSIPLAIVSSLIIILVAYVTSSMVLTLIVPYDQVDQDSALVEMFGQVGAYKCKYIVAVGALAGLTVSMFGSMFPMPRIVYAMAQDGLIFRSLSHVWPATGTPAIATLTSGICAAFAALLIQLEVLVEMMSIGTLLAYTLVSTCVLILRYQPHSTNLVELLPQSLRTPCRSPTKETQGNGQVSYGKELRPDQLTTALNSVQASQSELTTTNNGQRITVRRVRRCNSSSPDSDDTYGGEEDDVGLGKDDQYLVSDRTENKFYGSVHAAAAASSCGSAHQYPGNTPIIGPPLNYLQRRLQAAQYLCPAIFPWVDRGPATEASGRYVMKLVGILYLLILIFDLIIVCGMGNMGTFSTILLFVFLFAIIGILLAISRKPQNRSSVMFMTPGLPFVPAIAVTVNIYLIFKLSILTLVRFTVWMILGFIMYFYYGIKHSSLEEANASENVDDIVVGGTGGNIELTVTDHHQQYTTPDRSIYEGQQLDAFGQPVFGSTNFGGTPNQQQQQRIGGGYQQRQTASGHRIDQTAPTTTTLFIDQETFPSWDD